jgi:hypothetical protein
MISDEFEPIGSFPVALHDYWCGAIERSETAGKG